MFDLHSSESVAVVVQDGEFYGIWARSSDDVIPYADFIQESMLNLKKIKEYNTGYWVWTFSDDYKYLNGNKLKL